MANTDKDFKIRKALAWSVCHKLRKIWKSTLSKRIKIRLFIATVESVLLYGAETWTITQTMKTQLDSCYNRMLRMALNISWKQHIPNIQLYGELSPVSTKYNKDERGSLGIVSDTVMELPTNLSCGSQRMGMQTGEGKRWLMLTTCCKIQGWEIQANCRQSWQ